MNIGRIFANAIVRRLAYVVVAIALAWLGAGEARAQEPTGCGQSQNPRCTLLEAQALCQQWLAWRASVETGYVTDNCTRSAEYFRGGWRRTQPSTRDSAILAWYWGGCPAGYVWDDVLQTCGLPCDGKTPISAESAHAPGDSDKFCSEGCAYTCSSASLLLTVDGQTRTVCAGAWATSGTATCSVDEMPAPIAAVTDADGDGTSDGNDSSPNNPGSGGGGPEDASDTGNPDAPGSGNGNTSGGGGDCNTPPRSTGDAILAQIAFQTWATRCALVGNANAGTGTGSGDGDGSGLDSLRGEVGGLDQGQGDANAGDAWIDGPSTVDLDTSGLGFGGTCPAPPTVNGQSIDPDGILCMLVQIIGSLVMVGAFAHAGYIIGRS